MNNVLPNIYCGRVVVDRRRFGEYRELDAVERRANFFKSNDETNLLYELYERESDDRICPICGEEMIMGIGVRTVESYGHRTVFKANICPTCIEMMADKLKEGAT